MTSQMTSQIDPAKLVTYDGRYSSLSIMRMGKRLHVEIAHLPFAQDAEEFVAFDSTTSEGVEAAKIFRSSGEVPRHLKGAFDSVFWVDSENELAYRFSWSRDRPPTQALREWQITQHREGRAVPAWLTGALYASCHLFGVELVRNILGHIVHAIALPNTKVQGVETPWPSNAIEKDAAKIAQAQLDQLLASKQDAVELTYTTDGAMNSAIRFELGRLCWQPAAAVKIRHAMTEADPKRSAALNAHLGAWIAMAQDKGLVTFSGVKLPVVPGRSNPMLTWPMWLMLHDVSVNSVKQLIVPFEAPPVCDFAALTNLELGSEPPTAEPHMLLAMARQLCSDAAAHAAYAPAGVFDVAIPSQTPLAGWGVTVIRIVLWGQKPYIALFGHEPKQDGGFRRRTLAAFDWSPQGGLPGPDLLLIAPWSRPTVDLAISAIWHDLHVAGPTVFRDPSSRPEREPGSGRPNTGAVDNTPGAGGPAPKTGRTAKHPFESGPMPPFEGWFRGQGVSRPRGPWPLEGPSEGHLGHLTQVKGNSYLSRVDAASFSMELWTVFA